MDPYIEFRVIVWIQRRSCVVEDCVESVCDLVSLSNDRRGEHDRGEGRLGKEWKR